MKFLFGIYDTKSQTYSDLQSHDTLEALNQFLTVMVNLPSGDQSTYPNDFAVYEFGIFDEFDGELLAHPKPVLVHNTLEVFKKELETDEQE